jgi:hypothetical protein
LSLYLAEERRRKIEDSRTEREEEVQIASNELVGDNLREEREIRRVCIIIIL